MAVQNAPVAPQQTVLVQNRQLKASPFVPDKSDQLGTAQNWESWLESFERELRFFKITDTQDKVDALIIYGGNTISTLDKSLPNPTEGDLDDYGKLKKKLNDYFLPKKNKHHARYKFLKTRPEPGETVSAYATRLREKASECEFTDGDDQILEHLIQTITDKRLVHKAISKKWSLDEFTTEAAQLEDVQLQVRDMTVAPDEKKDVASVKKKTHQKKQHRKFRVHRDVPVDSQLRRQSIFVRDVVSNMTNVHVQHMGSDAGSVMDGTILGENANQIRIKAKPK